MTKCTLTTSAGAPVANIQNSLMANLSGRVLEQDDQQRNLRFPTHVASLSK